MQVVGAGGFTRAAENMQRPKATVSTHIQVLAPAKRDGRGRREELG